MYALNLSGCDGLIKAGTAQSSVYMQLLTSTEFAIIEPLKIFEHSHYSLYFQRLMIQF